MNLPHWLEFGLTLVGGWMGGMATMAVMLSRWIRKIEMDGHATQAVLSQRISTLETLIGLDGDEGVRGELERLVKSEHRRYNRLTQGLLRLGSQVGADLSDIFNQN